MKKAASIFLLVILSLISSCKKDCYRDLTSEEIRRLGYVGGETLIFKSNTGLYDTVFMETLMRYDYPKQDKCNNSSYYYYVGGSFKHKLNTNVNGVGFNTKIANPEKKDNSYVYSEIHGILGIIPLRDSKQIFLQSIINRLIMFSRLTL